MYDGWVVECKWNYWRSDEVWGEILVVNSAFGLGAGAGVVLVLGKHGVFEMQLIVCKVCKVVDQMER